MEDLELLAFASAKNGRRHHIRRLSDSGTPVGPALCNADPVQWSWRSAAIAYLLEGARDHYLRIACHECARRAGLEIISRKPTPALQKPRVEPTI